MRLSSGEQEFCEWLLKIGNGDISKLKIPEICSVKSLDDLIKSVFNFEADNSCCYFQKAILCTTNDCALKVNDKVTKTFPGTSKTYCSADSIVFDCGDTSTIIFTTETLNNFTPSGMPPHELILKVGSVVMLMRNMSIKHGLCNGTRLVVKKMMPNVLDCEIIMGKKYWR